MPLIFPIQIQSFTKINYASLPAPILEPKGIHSRAANTIPFLPFPLVMPCRWIILKWRTCPRENRKDGNFDRIFGLLDYRRNDSRIKGRSGNGSQENHTNT